MLAVLLLEMEWRKENRNPADAALRQEYYKPIRIEEGVNLSGSGIFLVKCHYYQQGHSILSGWDASNRLDHELRREGAGKAFTGSDERVQRAAGRRVKTVQREKGAFYDIEKLDIPCITVCGEPGGSYRIKWYDDGRGMPRRKGGNEDFCKKGARLAGRPNTLNETAFVLGEGKAGILKYNYRFASYEGQWYKCFYTFAVNEKGLARDIFIRDYDYEYDQLADLF